MNRPSSFGQCIKTMLTSRDLSIQQGAQILGMKSATSLARIIHDEVNSKTLERFYEALLLNPLIALQPEEKAQMEQALKICRIGLEDYLTHQAIWQLLLTDKQADPGEISVESICSTGSRHHQSFSQLIDLYMRSSKIELTITGCCNAPLLQALYPLAENPNSSISITHYLHNVEGAPHILLGGLAAIRKFLSLNQYTAYITDSHVLPPKGMALYEGNEMLCSFIDPNGKKRMHHYTMVAPDHLMLIEYRNAVPFLYQLSLLSYYRHLLSPIKLQSPKTINPNDYIHFADMYRKLETDRTFYCIKPDVPFAFIHPDIQLQAAQHGPYYGGTEPTDDIVSTAKRLYAIHSQRWQNIFSKKKVSHTILSIPAMKEFLHTGVLTDHFFILRPYTPAERRQILVQMRRNMQENPYFNVYFAKDDSLPFYLEITCFGQAGVLLSNAHSSYNLSMGHSEALIPQQDFSRTFQDFFLHELLPHHVLPARDTMNLMDQWIAALPEAD